MKRGACWIDLDFLPQALTMLARAGLKCVAIISDPWDPRALVAIDGDLLPPECEGNRRFVAGVSQDADGQRQVLS